MVEEMMLICVVIAFTILDTALATRCLQCDDIPAPFECNTIVECGGRDQCFLQQYVNVQGRVLYSMGCEDVTRCNYRKRSVDDIVTCIHCCHDDHCNMEGCGEKAASLTTRGPKCYNCPDAVTPESCRQTQNCDSDEVCGLVHSLPGLSAPTWRGRCILKVQCSTIASISIGQTGCDICCTGDLCNDRCHRGGSYVVPTSISHVPGVLCLQCADMPNPFDCNVVTMCSHDEQCFVEEYVNTAGAVMFETGCMSKQHCAPGKRGTGLLEKRQKITVCRMCCTGNFCNTKGCGATVPSLATRGPKCFSCRAQSDPNDCRDTTTCSRGEVCSLFKNNDFSQTWASSCMKRLQCDAIANIRHNLLGKKRTASTECVKCCDDDFCNANCHPNGTATPGSHTTAGHHQHTTHKPTHAPTTTPIPTHAPTHAHHTHPQTTTHKPTHKPTTHKPTTAMHIPTPPNNHQTITHAMCTHHHYHYDSQSKLCYMIYYDHHTWYDCNRKCNSLGATLAIVSTKEKWEFLLARIKADIRLNDSWVYIGGHDYDDGVYRWVDHTVVHFNNWAAGQPNGGTAMEDCMGVAPSAFGYKWYDMDCYRPQPYICTFG